MIAGNSLLGKIVRSSWFRFHAFQNQACWRWNAVNKPYKSKSRYFWYLLVWTQKMFMKAMICKFRASKKCTISMMMHIDALFLPDFPCKNWHIGILFEDVRGTLACCCSAESRRSCSCVCDSWIKPPQTAQPKSSSRSDSWMRLLDMGSWQRWW